MGMMLPDKHDLSIQVRDGAALSYGRWSDSDGVPMTDEKFPYPLENMRTITTDSATWLAERERRGATRVEMDQIFEDAVAGFPVSTSSPIAEPRVEMSTSCTLAT